MLYPDEEVERVRSEVLDAVPETGRWRGETTGLGADGGTFVEDHTIAETSDGGLVCVVREASEAESPAELGSASQSSQTRNERLERFANVVARDVRGPLNVAQGRLNLARNRLAGADDDACDEVTDVDDDLAIAAGSLERIEGRLAELLALSRDEGSVDSPERVSLAMLAEKAWHNVRADEATMHVVNDLAFRAEPVLAGQLLENLLANAVLHAGARIEVGSLPDGFYVADDGVGIPADDREVGFDPGFTTDADGCGWGMAIVDDVAGAHGWRVDVADTEDGGARVEVRDVDVATGDDAGTDTVEAEDVTVERSGDVRIEGADDASADGTSHLSIEEAGDLSIEGAEDPRTDGTEGAGADEAGDSGPDCTSSD